MLSTTIEPGKALLFRACLLAAYWLPTDCLLQGGCRLRTRFSGVSFRMHLKRWEN